MDLHLREGPGAPGHDWGSGGGYGDDESGAAVEEVEDDLGAAWSAGGGPHVGAEGGDAGEEDEEAAVGDGVGGVGVAEGDDAGGFREDFVG